MTFLPTTKVIALALCVRSLHLALLISSDAVFTDYDSSASLNSEITDLKRCHVASPAAVTNLVVWDAVHYADIACNGYRYEKQYAFFPLLPALCYWWPAGIPLLGMLISHASFVASAALLSRLSIQVLQSDVLSTYATLFYIFNPAGVFYTVSYTESLFAMLTFLGLYLLYCKHATWAATVAFALATSTRSNGIINCGFLLHDALSQALACLRAGKIAGALWHVLRGELAAVVAASPVAAFQIHGYLWFCNSAAAAWCPGWLSQLLHLPPAQLQPHARPWCSWAVPRIYNYVQAQYWGVGFLKYYQWQQMPNFLLAAPVLILSASGCCAYICHNPWHFMCGGLFKPDGSSKTSNSNSSSSSPHQPVSKGSDHQGRRKQAGFLAPSVAVFIYPWMFMVLCGALVMHVQVSTRFLSSCPALYWYMAHVWRQRRARSLWAFCLAYNGLGSILLPNFLPWT